MFGDLIWAKIAGTELAPGMRGQRQGLSLGDAERSPIIDLKRDLAMVGVVIMLSRFLSFKKTFADVGGENISVGYCCVHSRYVGIPPSYERRVSGSHPYTTRNGVSFNVVW